MKLVLSSQRGLLLSKALWLIMLHLGQRWKETEAPPTHTFMQSKTMRPTCSTEACTGSLLDWALRTFEQPVLFSAALTERLSPAA